VRGRVSRPERTPREKNPVGVARFALPLRVGDRTEGSATPTGTLPLSVYENEKTPTTSPKRSSRGLRGLYVFVGLPSR
jgi:hypothetical protein